MENHLHFNGDGKLKIVQFTDVHWNDGCRKDRKTAALMRKILGEEAPDFIVLTGDTVYGERNLKELESALAPVLEAGVPWALVFGNHDTEWGRSREELCEKAMSLPNCRMERGDPSLYGVGNYVIPVRDNREKLCWAFYFLDSNAYNDNKRIGGYDYIHRDQICWYADTDRGLTEKEGFHSALAFFHIALPEYNDAWNYSVCYGHKNETICCPYQNSGMFSAMLEAGNMRGVFVGHDHVNDFDGEYQGIRLVFGRGTGYNTYGKRGFPRGARVIELDAAHPEQFLSWLRLDTGAAVLEPPPHPPKQKKATY